MSRKKKIALLVLVLTLVFIFFLILANFNIRIPCIFKEITGFNCPGCGNTRATVALFHFDFKEMLRCNLLYPLQIIYLLQFFVISAKNYIKGGKFDYKSKSVVIDIVFLIALVLWGIIRNIVPFFAI